MDERTIEKAPRRRTSPILAAVHAFISGLHRAGVVDLATLRAFTTSLGPAEESLDREVGEHASTPLQLPATNRRLRWPPKSKPMERRAPAHEIASDTAAAPVR